jgi:hypothetical protein
LSAVISQTWNRPASRSWRSIGAAHSATHRLKKPMTSSWLWRSAKPRFPISLRSRKPRSR